MPPSHTNFVIYLLDFVLARFFSINTDPFSFLTKMSKSHILSDVLTSYLLPLTAFLYAPSICHKLYYPIPPHNCTHRKLSLAHGCPPGVDINLWRISGWTIARGNRLENLWQRRISRNSDCRWIRLAGPHIALGIRQGGICSTRQWAIRALGALIGIFQTH